MIRSRKKLPKDQNKLAAEIVRLSTEEPEQAKESLLINLQEEPSKELLSKYFSEIGRKGGLKGGKARAEKLSEKRKSEIAKKAAKARWGKKK